MAGPPYHLVIGADGIHSTVRQLMFGGRGPTVGQLVWRFVTACPAEITTWTVFLGRGIAFLAVPIGGGRSIATATVIDRTGHADGIGVDAAAGRLRRSRSAILDGIGTETAVTRPYEEVLLDGWARGSVLLVGDAAHATSPNMAEGVAMALEDALILSDCLAAGHGIGLQISRVGAARAPRGYRPRLIAATAPAICRPLSHFCCTWAPRSDANYAPARFAMIVALAVTSGR